MSFQHYIIYALYGWILNLLIGTLLCNITSAFNKPFRKYLNTLSFTETFFLFSLGLLSLLSIPYSILRSEKYVVKKAKFKVGDKIKIKENSIGNYTNTKKTITENTPYTINRIGAYKGKVRYFISGEIISFYESDIEKFPNRKERINNLY